jgi:hypothetical protein
MTKQAIARMVTIAVLALALGAAVARKINLREQPSKSTPQDAVYAMLDAARSGDVKKYLASYTAPISESLERARSESRDFSKYLRDQNESIKGVAVMEPQPLPDGQVELLVDYVYDDRNESQLFYLANTAGGWKISRIEPADRAKTLIPYGTPVQ